MSSVDDRIVNMQFNNREFTKGVTKTKQDLEGLNKSLANSGKNKGLQGLGAAADGVSGKLTAMKVAGLTAVGTIASKATSAGINLVKSLTIDPILDGFREYQTGLESVQTIMANTGKPVEAVNKALDKLNDYSDKTIYNFGQMAKNVGTFTAAGVDLDTSVQSIKGIANLAALSGSSSEQASNAMYQLSQAIAAGKVGLQDWNSVVNAGMGGKIFQTALARTAQNMGTLGDNAVKMVGPMDKLTIKGNSFRQSIQADAKAPTWLTSEVLVETLKQVAGGFSLAELKAKGYSDAQAKAIVDLQKRAFAAATQIKTLPQLLGVIRESIGSTFAGIFRTMLGDFKQSKKLWTDVGFAIIGPRGFLTKAQVSLDKFVKQWAKLGGRNKAIDAFKTGFKALGAIFSQVGKAFRDVFPPSTTNLMFEMTKGFQSLMHALTPSVGTLKSLRSIFGGIFAILHIGLSVVGSIKDALVGFFGAILQNSGAAGGGILKIVASVAEVVKAFDRWLTAGGKLSEVMTRAGNVAGAFVAPLVAGIGLIVKALASLASGEGVAGFLAPFGEAKAKLAEFGSSVVGALANLTAPFEKVSAFFLDIKAKLDGFTSGFDSISGKAEGISSRFDALTGAGSRLGGAADTVKSAVGGMASNFDRVSGATDKVKSSVTDMYDAFTGSDSASASTKTEQLASMGEKAKERWSQLGDVFSWFGSVLKKAFFSLDDAFKYIEDKLSNLFGGFDAIDFASFTNALLTGGLLLALKKGVDATTSLSDIFSSLKGVFEETQNSLQSWQKSLKAKMLMEIAIAIALLTASLIALSLVDAEKLAVGLGAITVMMADLSGMLLALSKIEGEMDMAILATSLLLISAAMLNLAGAITILGQQDPKKVAAGLGFMTASLAVMVGAILAFSQVSAIAKGAATGILIMSAAMIVLAAAILAFGLMPMDVLIQGLAGMAVGLTLLVGALLGVALMGPAVAKAAPAFYIMAASMTMLSLAVRSFGSMDIPTLVQGFAAIAIGLGLMVGALLLLSNFGGTATVAAGAMVMMALALNLLIPPIIMLGSIPWEVAARGIGFVALALGVLLLAALGAIAVAPGLAILGATILAIGVAMGIAGAGMLAFGAGFALLAVAGVAGVAVLTAAFKVFIALLPSLAVQVAAAFVSFVETIAKAAPRVRAAMATIIRNMLGAVRDAIPEIGKTLQVLITTGIGVLRNSIPQWVEMGFTVIDKFMKSAEKHVPSIAKSAISMVRKFLDTVGNEAPKLANSAAQMIIKFIDGVTRAINNNADDLRRAGGDLAMAIVNGLTGGLLGAGVGMVQRAAASLASHIPGPIRKFLGISSPSRVMRGIGQNVAVSMAMGINDNIKNAVAAASRMANAVIAEGDRNVLKAKQRARKAQNQANLADAKADVITARRAKAQQRLNAAARSLKAHPKSAAAKAEKRRAQANLNAEKRRETAQRKVATAAQKTADRRAKAVEAAKTWAAADFHGKGEIKDDAAIALTNRSNVMLAKAQAEALEARRLMRTNRTAGRAMLAQSAKDAKAAKALAQQAQAAHKAATEYYAKEVNQRIADITKQREADKKAREEEEAYEAADTAGKIEIQKKREEEAKAKEATAQKRYEALIAQAQALAKTDAAKAMRLLEQAETAAEEAEAAADAAEQARDDIEQLQGGGAGGSSSPLEPSRSALEDAARAVDRYTQSLHEAMESAAAQQTTVTFVQNNNSPVSLTASEVYRQTRNLLTASQLKMGAKAVATT